MKLKQLFEMPHLKQEDGPSFSNEERPSYNGLLRDNDLLLSIERYGQRFNIWLNHKRNCARISTEEYDKITKEDRQLVVVSVNFSNRINLDLKNLLQVNTVYTLPGYRQRDLASLLYIVLAAHDNIIVSDFTHYLGGKELWKKLAKISEAFKFHIQIWNDETQDWVKQNNKNIRYNASNLDDDTIWTEIENVSTSLLVLFPSDQLINLIS